MPVPLIATSAAARSPDSGTAKGLCSTIPPSRRDRGLTDDCQIPSTRFAGTTDLLRTGCEIIVGVGHVDPLMPIALSGGAKPWLLGHPGVLRGGTAGSANAPVSGWVTAILIGARAGAGPIETIRRMLTNPLHLPQSAVRLCCRSIKIEPDGMDAKESWQVREPYLRK